MASKKPKALGCELEAGAGADDNDKSPNISPTWLWAAAGVYPADTLPPPWTMGNRRKATSFTCAWTELQFSEME